MTDSIKFASSVICSAMLFPVKEAYDKYSLIGYVLYVLTDSNTDISKQEHMALIIVCLCLCRSCYH